MAAGEMSSKISWLAKAGYKPETWEIVEGCTKVSAGCKNCWAEAMHPRLGTGHPFNEVLLRPDRLEEPLDWRKPRMVFVCSRSDLFHEQVSGYFMARALDVMETQRRHIFIVLTKRPEIMQPLMEDRTSCTPGCPSPNVWLGVSVEDQATADERIPLLLETPAKVYVISYEPALGPVDLSPWLPSLTLAAGGGPARVVTVDNRFGTKTCGYAPALDWVLVGGESGRNFRPCEAEWIADVARQCRDAGVSCFVKQDAHRYPERQGRIPDDLWAVKEWPNGRGTDD